MKIHRRAAAFVGARPRHRLPVARHPGKMPENPRLVLELRDMKGLSAEDVRNVLGISASNARVLLCRARTRQETGKY